MEFISIFAMAKSLCGYSMNVKEVNDVVRNSRSLSLPVSLTKETAAAYYDKAKEEIKKSKQKYNRGLITAAEHDCILGACFLIKNTTRWAIEEEYKDTFVTAHTWEE